jgi:glycerate 2-kinase
VLTLILSDVIGDPLDIIASGPTVCPTASPTAAADIVRQYGLTEDDMGPAVSQLLLLPSEKEDSLDSQVFENVTNLVVGNISLALQSIVEKASEVTILNYCLVSIK